MIDSEEMSFNIEDLIIYRKNQLVIIYNKKFRKYIRLSEEIYKYFLLSQENKMNAYDFVNCFDDESDRKYIINLIDIMNKNKIFKSNNLDTGGLRNEIAIYFCLTNRGRGVFNKVINSVNLLKENGFNNIKLSMVFGQKNAHLNQQFKDLNKKLGTEFVERCFIPTGRGLENKENYLFEDTVLPITIPYILDNELKKFKDKKNKKMGCCACNAGNSQIFINYDGNVYPCPSLIKDEYKMGNIFDNEFVQVIKGNKTRSLKSLIKLESIYPYNFEKCKDCDVNIFCWHCPAILDSVKDNELELDRWCRMMKHNLNTAVWGDEKVN